MNTMDGLMWICLLLSVCLSGVYCQTPDPCTSHVIINDTTMDVSYTTENRHGFAIHTFDTWYRYTTTGQGVLSASCPHGNQCGTQSQAWSNDTLPGVEEGPKRVSLFIKQHNNCVARQHPVEVKNCQTFAVYKLPPLPPGSQYCFDKSATPIQPVTTTSTPQTTTSTQPTTTVTTSTTPRPVTTTSTPHTPTTTQPPTTGLLVPTKSSTRFFVVDNRTVAIQPIPPDPKAYNQCYVSVSVFYASGHQIGLPGAKVTVLSRKPQNSFVNQFDYSGFSEGTTGSSGRVCLLVYCYQQALIFVEKNSVKLFAAKKEKQQLPPHFRVDILSANEMVAFHSYAWGPILGHTGPVYANIERDICTAATKNDYHFVFSYISIPDQLVSTLAPVDSTDLMNTLSWRYGFPDQKNTCYLKILIRSNSNDLVVRAYSRLHDASGLILGMSITGPKYDTSLPDHTKKAACLKYRCPALDIFENSMNTFVEGNITDANGKLIRCISYRDASQRQGYQMNGTSFASLFTTGGNYGPLYGIYIDNDPDMARSKCFHGSDTYSGNYTMNVDNGYAMEYDCTGFNIVFG